MWTSRLDKSPDHLAVYDKRQKRSFSKLYQFCANNNILAVERYIKNLSIKDINRVEVNGNTALHIAVLNRSPEIIKLLLKRNACRSIRNINNHRPYEIAETDEIRNLFKRENCHTRFTYVNGCLPYYQQQKKSYKTFSSNKNTNLNQVNRCSLCDNEDPCEWEILDDHAAEKAERFRRESKHSMFYGHGVVHDLQNKISSIKKGYLGSRLRGMQLGDSIKYFFNKASKEQNPFYIIKAYTSGTSFYKYVNGDMARNVIHDLKQGCSQFFCTRLYSTQDGVMSITSILLHHPSFESYSYIGKVYRGMTVNEMCLSNYRCGIRIVNTTFLSTSKTLNVAKQFNNVEENPNNDVSVLCIYKIRNSRTALYIAEISEFPEEDEVLILPFAAFEIMSITRDTEKTEICLEECDRPKQEDDKFKLPNVPPYFVSPKVKRTLGETIAP
ncbi:unnamed protein product [Didymodactylos carnosus]|uniref:NAD(P)(+)--arginine ADP-ribosyltransferase n=1 Tax=Didymodactylos carnosus TaxID=1234261 RepID=A0A815C1N9_9BILA|nr:unnamed protein product [Didymodactylos carnosus]CAF1277025.1 unnamed protein product [Didymodactylos carnosus]CAF3869983.1 unnamed protein product [Didymodactylos carnosus]CAF4069294.1 unnamed protein product [Didymodactylos carnosus]